HNKRFGGTLDADRAALLAVFHDASEIITGDMPTPIKYANPDIRDVYKQI
ncbi:MAG: HD domain-containing protein, partial [Ruminococcus sp.]|nr:HD domain-containing protein [Ruminococcus sp.]